MREYLEVVLVSEGRFYCHWCGKMHPIEERREEVDNTEFVVWIGCKDCYKKYKQKLKRNQHGTIT